MNEFRREITLQPAYDRRDPDPSKNYGIHGVTLRMVLIGDEGATQFVLYTNWQLPHVTADMVTRPIRDKYDVQVRWLPLPADLGYHSRVPRYDGQEPIRDQCEYTGGGPCYYDGSGLAAERVFERLLREGDAGVWAELEDYYRDRLAATPDPEPER